MKQYMFAQCGTPISLFPYTEGFETTNGSWTTGGTASDWVWGTPAKPVITGAATAAFTYKGQFKRVQQGSVMIIR